jgi:hypothetical protein
VLEIFYFELSGLDNMKSKNSECLEIDDATLNENKIVFKACTGKICLKNVVGFQNIRKVMMIMPKVLDEQSNFNIILQSCSIIHKFNIKI